MYYMDYNVVVQYCPCSTTCIYNSIKNTKKRTNTHLYSCCCPVVPCQHISYPDFSQPSSSTPNPPVAATHRRVTICCSCSCKENSIKCVLAALAGSAVADDLRNKKKQHKSRSTVKRDSQSSHSHKHSSGKRKHGDRLATPDDRKRRKAKKGRE